MADSLELEPAEPVPTVAGDPDYDDDWRFLPFVREHGRDVPYRLSDHYENHKRSWGRLSMRQKIGDLKRLLPKLQALRKRATPEPTSPEEFPAELAALGIKRGDERDDDFAVKNITDALRWTEIETSDDVLIRHIIADVRWPTRFWLDLKARDPKLIQAVERACRPGVNRRAGNKKGNIRNPIPADMHEPMQRKARELRDQITKLKTFWKKNRRNRALCLQQAADYVKSIRTKPADELAKKLDQNERPADIVTWLVARHFDQRLKHTEFVLR